MHFRAPAKETPDAPSSDDVPGSFCRHGVRNALSWLVAVFFILAGVPAAMAQGALDEENPRVERIIFEGADAADEGDIRGSIVTQATRCRGLILQPICWVTDWRGVVERHYLDRQELERDEVRVAVYYFRQGYRGARVDSEVRPHEDGVEVVFYVEEGEPTIIASSELRQTEEVLSRRRIRRASLPGEGDLLNLDDLELAMEYLYESLGELGYLDAEVRDSIAVGPDVLTADLEVIIEPGPRSTLEGLEIEGNDEISDQTISNALRLKQGRVVRTTDIVAAQRGLYESNLFHEARVDVPEQEDSAKTIEVRVREAPPRMMRVGGGFNTIEFIQTEAAYTHYNWLGGGRRLQLRATVGNLLAGQLNGRAIFRDVVPSELSSLDETPFLRPTWQVSAELRQPAFQSAENVLGVDLSAHRRTIPGVVVDKAYGGDVSITRRIDYDTPLSVTYAYEITSVEAGDLYFCVNYGVCDAPTIGALRGSHSMSPFSINLLTNRTDDPLAPATGHRARVDAEHASSLTLSDFRYNRISGEASYYIPFDVHRRRVAAGRIRAGWVRPLESTGEAVGVPLFEDQALLHPRKRFYAGGSRSVRGYGENQLGPRILTVDPLALLEPEDGCTREQIANGTCDPTVAPVEAFLPRPLGGTAVLEASAEYRFPLFGQLIGAVFIDGALVGEGLGGLFSRESSAITPGFGARYMTPVGPIRIDLGIRPSITERLPVVTEIENEEGFNELVRLENRRRYNPVEAAGGGFLREILARLTLHLSIGEAF